jgi:TonB family protein
MSCVRCRFAAMPLLVVLVAMAGCATFQHNGKLQSPVTRASLLRPPRPGPGFPAFAAYYPPDAKFLGEEGSVVVHVCVDAAGRLTVPPTVDTSSGNLMLDAAAVRLANAGNGHYEPGARDSVPVESCGVFKVNFTLDRLDGDVKDPT